MSSSNPPTVTRPRAALTLFGVLAFALLLQAARVYSAGLFEPLLLLLAGLHHASAALLGTALLVRLAPSLRGLGESWLLGWAFGLGVFGHLWLALAHLDLFDPWTAWLVPTLGLAGALLVRADLPSAPREVAAVVWDRWGPAWLGLVAVVLALCTLPPTFYDAASYHVALPQQWAQWGRAIVSEHFVYSAIPLNAELSLSPLLLAVGAPDAVNAGSGFNYALLVLLTAATAKRLFGRAGASAFVVATMPLAIFLAVGTKSDTLTSVHALALLYVVSTLPERGAPGRWENALLTGSFAGWMLATKTPALALLPFVLVLLAAVPSWRAALGGWRGVATSAGVAALLGAPVWLQNAWLLGNPLFPALSSVFGGPPEQEQITRMLAAQNTTVGFGDLWRLPWDLTFVLRNPTMNNLPGPLLLLCAPVAALLRPLPRPLGRALVVAAVTVPAWLVTQSLLRYDPFVWLALALLAGWVLGRLGELSRGARVLVGAVVAVTAVVNLHWSVQAHEALLRRPSEYLTGKLDRDAFLAQAYEPWTTYRFINERLDEDAVILPMSDARLLYLQRRALLSELQARPVWDAPIASATDAADVGRRLRALGATHLLLNERQAGRAKGLGWARWPKETEERFSAFVSSLGEPLFADKGFRLWELPAR
jgi:hypothetical protein